MPWDLETAKALDEGKRAGLIDGGLLTLTLPMWNDRTRGGVSTLRPEENPPK